LALATRTAPAEVRGIDAGRLDGFEQAHSGRDLDRQPGLGEIHVEGLTDGWWAELLEMDVAVRPAQLARGPDRALEQPGRPADVDVRAEQLPGQDLDEVYALTPQAQILRHPILELSL